MQATVLPIWLQALMAVATLCISTAIAVAAWGQWHVARQKVVLDLFDKRYARYQELRSATGTVEREGYLDDAAWRAFTRATYEMEYLFGSDVEEHLQAIRETGLNLRMGMLRLQRPRLPVGTPLLDKTALEVEVDQNRFDKLLKDLYPKLIPYLRMDQRVPSSMSELLRTLINWVKHRWEQRPTGE